MGEEAPLNLKYKDGPPVDEEKVHPRLCLCLPIAGRVPGCCPSSYSCDHGCVCTTEGTAQF